MKIRLGTLETKCYLPVSLKNASKHHCKDENIIVYVVMFSTISTHHLDFMNS